MSTGGIKADYKELLLNQKELTVELSILMSERTNQDQELSQRPQEEKVQVKAKGQILHNLIEDQLRMLLKDQVS